VDDRQCGNIKKLGQQKKKKKLLGTGLQVVRIFLKKII
jgi:hypothetical protein